MKNKMQGCRIGLFVLTATAATALLAQQDLEGAGEQLSPMEAQYERALIRELQDRYGVVHDFGSPEEYASLFTDDGAIASGEGPPLVQGREALLAFAKRDQERWHGEPAADGSTSSIMRHLISNSEVELTGPDSASGMSYVTTLVQKGEVGPAILSVGRYVDEYRKQDGEWRISRRIIKMDFGDQDLALRLGFRSE